ncbi:MAG: hypothetical protein ABID54_10725 [Pseudomonadota bacterium]
MKAKEYLAQFEKDSERLGDREATINLMDGILLEIKTLTEMRKAQSNEAILSILLELNDKWNALCRLDKKGQFKKDGFINLVRIRVSEEFPWIAKHFDKEVKEKFHLEEKL